MSSSGNRGKDDKGWTLIYPNHNLILTSHSSRELFVPKMPKILSVVLSLASFGTFHLALGSPFSTNSKPLLRMRCCLFQQRRPSRSVLDSGVLKSQVVSTMTLLSVTRAAGFEPLQTGVEVFKGVSPTGKTFTSGITSIEIITIAKTNLFRVGSASSRQPPYLRPRKRHNTMGLLVHWRQGVAMTRVSSLAQSRSSRPWQPLWSWTNFLSKTLAKLPQAFSLLSLLCHPRW